MKPALVLATAMFLLTGCSKKISPGWAEIAAALPDGIKLERDSTPDELPLVAEDRTAVSASGRVRDALVKLGWTRVDTNPDVPDQAHVSMRFVKAGGGVIGLESFLYMGKKMLVSLRRSTLTNEADELAKIARTKLSGADADALVQNVIKRLPSIVSQFEAGTKAPRRCPDAALAALPKAQLEGLQLIDYAHAADLAKLPHTGFAYDFDFGSNLVADLEELGNLNPARRDIVLAAAPQLARDLDELKVVLLYRVRASSGTKATNDSFTGGRVAGDLVLVEVPSGRPICAETFSASSSSSVEVTTTNGRSNASSAVRRDLNVNVSGEMTGVLARLSPQLKLAPSRKKK